MSCFIYSKCFALSKFSFYLVLNVAATFNHPSAFLRLQCMHKSPEKLTEMQISLGRPQGHDRSKLPISFTFISVLFPMSENLILRRKSLNLCSSLFCNFWGHYYCNPHLKGPSNVSDMPQPVRTQIATLISRGLLLCPPLIPHFPMPFLGLSFFYCHSFPRFSLNSFPTLLQSHGLLTALQT